jgi:hypothetical protein
VNEPPCAAGVIREAIYVLDGLLETTRSCVLASTTPTRTARPNSAHAHVIRSGTYYFDRATDAN